MARKIPENATGNPWCVHHKQTYLVHDFKEIFIIISHYFSIHLNSSSCRHLSNTKIALFFFLGVFNWFNSSCVVTQFKWQKHWSKINCQRPISFYTRSDDFPFNWDNFVSPLHFVSVFVKSLDTESVFSMKE